jgi:ribosomal protein L16 Arg81 hydroxylase
MANAVADLDISELVRLSQLSFDKAEPVLMRGIIADPEDFFGETRVQEYLAEPRLVSRSGIFRKQELVGVPSEYTPSFIESHRGLSDTTVVYRGVQRLPGLVRDVCVALADSGNWPSVHAVALESPEGVVSLKPHWDMYPVFAVQTAGRKRWIVQRPIVDTADDVVEEWYKRSYGNGLTEDQIRSVSPEYAADDVILERGDVYFVPAGWLHAPQGVGGRSLHVSISTMSQRIIDHPVDAGDGTFRPSGGEDHFFAL